MISAYSLSGDVLKEVDAPLTVFSDHILWIDLLNPSREEENAIEKALQISLPTHADMVEIEESSRFYMEDNAQFLTAPLLYVFENDKRAIAPVTFVLAAGKLITVRYTTPKAFSLYLSRAAKTGNGIVNSQSTGINILLGLLEAASDRLADLLENIAAKTTKASEIIFHRPVNAGPMSTDDFRRTLAEIGGQGDFLSMVRESIAGISRLLVYIDALDKVNPSRKEIRAAVKSLERDMQSLEHYADFLSNKMTFLLDTVVGMISTEQNAIIKIFSVAAVVFLPPTLIASIYGMNFKFMPETQSIWGYPFAVVLMIISAILPIVYFRKKGWL